VLAGLGFYLFIVHMFMADKRSCRPACPRPQFRCRHGHGVLRLHGHAGDFGLARAVLQNLAGYPVYTCRLGDGAARPGHHRLDVSRSRLGMRVDQRNMAWAS